MGKQIPASDVSDEVTRFLGELNITRHAGREKALKSFLKKMKNQGDEIYDDDVDIALLGKDGMQGLLVWAGEKSKKHGSALKRSSGLAMYTLYSLVTYNKGGLQDQNIWLSRLRNVSTETLHCMSLESHILAETHKGGLQAVERGAKYEACIIIQLLLDSHVCARTQEPEDLSLQDLVHSKEAQDIFMKEILSWKLMDKNSPARQWMLSTRELSASSPAARGIISEEESVGMDTVKETRDDPPRSFVSEKYKLALDDNSYPVNDRVPQTESQQLTTVHLTGSLLDFLNGLKGTMNDEEDEGRSSEKLHMKDPLALNSSFDLAVIQDALDAGVTAIGKEDNNLPSPPANDGDLDVVNGEKEIHKKPRISRKNVFRYLQSNRFQSGFFSAKPPPTISKYTTSTSPATSPVRLGKLFKVKSPSNEKRGGQVLLENIIPEKETFRPEIFMSIVHPDAGLDDLRKGLENLEKAKGEQVDQLNLLVKNNFNKFVHCSACIETYADQVGKELCPATCAEGGTVLIPASLSPLTLHANELKPDTTAEDRFIATSSHVSSSAAALEGGNETEAANSLVFNLSSLLDLAQSEAASEFSELLGKLDELEEARAAQSLLLRKRDLLNVPAKMQACLESKKYEQLVELYSFCYEAPSGRIELKVRQEANSVAQAAHRQLFSTLESESASIDDQLAAIKFLSMLGYDDGDPILPLSICLDDQTKHFAQTVNDVRAAYCVNLESALNLSPGINMLRKHKSVFGLPNAAAVDAEIVGHGSVVAVNETNFWSPAASPDWSQILSPHEPLNLFRNESGHYNNSSFHIVQPPRSAAADTPRGTEGFHVSPILQDDEDPSVHMFSISRLKHIQNICECLSSWIPHLAELSSHFINYELMSLEAGKGERGGGNGPSVGKTVQTLAQIRERGTSLEIFGSSSGLSESNGHRNVNPNWSASTKLTSDNKRTLLFYEWLSGSAQDVFTAVLGTGADFLQKDENKSIFNPTEYAQMPSLSQVDCCPSSTSTSNPSSTPIEIIGNFLSFPMGPAYMRPALQNLVGLLGPLNKSIDKNVGISSLLEKGMSNLKAAVLKIQEAYIKYVSDALRKKTSALKCIREEKLMSGNVCSHLPDLQQQSKKFETIIAQELKDLAALLPLPEASAGEVLQAVSHALDEMLRGFVQLISEARVAYGVEIDIGNTAFSTPAQLPDAVGHHKVLFCCLAECLYMEQVGMPKLRSLFKELFGPTVVLEDIAARDDQVFAEYKDNIQKHYVKDLKQLISKNVEEAWWGSSRINISMAEIAISTEQQSVMTSSSGGTVVTEPPPYLVKTLLLLVNTRLNASQCLGKWPFQMRPPKMDGLREEQKKSSYSVLYSEYLLRESVRLVMNIVCNCTNQCILGNKDLGIEPQGGIDLGDIASRIAQIEFLRDTLSRYVPSDTAKRISRSIQRLYHVIRDAGCVSTDLDTRINHEEPISNMIMQSLPSEESSSLLTVSKLQNSLRLYICALR